MGFDIGEKVSRRYLYLHGRSNFTDTIVHTITIWILIFFTILLSSNLMFGQLLTCYTPPETPDSWNNYYHDYCYYQEKFRLSQPNLVEEIRNERDYNQGTVLFEDDYKKAERYESKNEVITYYQWIPYTLILQMLLCLIPAIIWTNIGLRYFHGGDFDAIIRMYVSKMTEGESVVYTKWMDADILKKLVKDTHRWLKMKKGDRFGMHSTMIIYVLMKWTSFFSLFGQFILMANLYASGSLLWGVHMSYNLMMGATDDVYSGVFPQIVECNVLRVDIANVNTIDLRCILSQNFINEKAFLFLYWWYIFTSIISFFSAIRFTLLLLIPSYQRYATKSILPTIEYLSSTAGSQHNVQVSGDSDLLDYFIDYLGCDGFLLLQTVGDMLHLMAVRGLAELLWRRIIVQDMNDNCIDDDEEPKTEEIREDENDPKKKTRNPSAPPYEAIDGRAHVGKDSDPMKQLRRDFEILQRKMRKLEKDSDSETSPLLSEPSTSTEYISPRSSPIDHFSTENEEKMPSTSRK